MKKLAIILTLICASRAAAQISILPEYTAKKAVLMHLSCKNIKSFNFLQKNSDEDKVTNSPEYQYLVDIVANTLTRSDVYLDICDQINLKKEVRRIDYLSRKEPDSQKNFFGDEFFGDEDLDSGFQYYLYLLNTQYQQAMKSIGGFPHSLYIYNRNQERNLGNYSSKKALWLRNYSVIPAAKNNELYFIDYSRPYSQKDANLSDSTWIYDPYVLFLKARTAYTVPIVLSPARMSMGENSTLFVSESLILGQKKAGDQTTLPPFEQMLTAAFGIQKVVTLTTNANEGSEDLDTLLKLFKNKKTGKVEAILSTSASEVPTHFEENKAIDEKNRAILKANNITFYELSDASYYRWGSNTTYNYANSLILDEDTILIPSYQTVNAQQPSEVKKILPEKNKQAKEMYKRFFKNVVDISIPPMGGTIHCLTSDVPEWTQRK